MAGNYERKDHLYLKAKEEGYRSRAAYKLMELDERYRLLRAGLTVVDLGCYPGGWLQVALERVGPKGLVVGIDLRPVVPVTEAGLTARIIEGDIFGDGSISQIRDAVAQGADVLLSDMSPQLSGIKFRDAARSAELVERAQEVACLVLRDGGSLVAKTFPSPESDDLMRNLRADFSSVARPCLKSSRKSSNEFYFVARGFKAKNRG